MTLAKLVSCNDKLKKPRKSEGNIFTIYSPKKATIEQADTVTIDTGLLLKLPDQSKAYLVTKFTGQDIKELVGPTKQRLWITLLNESYFEKYTINKGDIVGYLVFEPDTLKVQYEAKEKQLRQSSSHTKRKYPGDYVPKNWQSEWKNYWQKTMSTITDRRISQSL